MLKNRIFHDLAIGGGLACALLAIFVIDRLVFSSASQKGPGATRMVRTGGTLLGDDQISERLKALGSEERLESLKVVRLTAKASFAEASNVNDITLMWCWEPRIIIRFEEINPALANSLPNLIELMDDAGKEELQRKLAGEMGANFELDRELRRQLESEIRKLFSSKDFKPLFDDVLILDDTGVFLVFNKRLSLPLKAARATQMRNLCFALSVSNLIPIRRHNFQVEAGVPQTVKGKMCDQFTVHDPGGLKLQFFFDKKTNLLAKIAHMGHNPHRLIGSDTHEVLWEHYFSDYRETEGIKRWRKAEVDTNGRRFATLDVADVAFFDEMRPEMKRPGQ